LRVSLVLSLVGGVLLSGSASAQTATGTVTGFVIGPDRAPLANTVVSLPAHGRERFTSATGHFLFANLAPGTTVLRVRRLGFEPLDLTVRVRAGAMDTVQVSLRRVAVHLSAVDVSATPPCLLPGAPQARRDSTLAVIYGQLLLNAEQSRVLSREYPFSMTLISTLSSRTTSGDMHATGVDTLRLRGDGGWKYQAGKVLALERRGGNRGKVTFLIPTLENFADPEFAASHCFHNRGLAKVQDSTMIQIDIVAAQAIRTTDVDGSIYLDPQSFQIRRTVLRLTRVPVPGLQEVEVVTDFRELMPSIPVIDRVLSTQVLDPSIRGYTNAYEEKKLAAFVFLGARPGEKQ
jgi:hypothetical protein